MHTVAKQYSLLILPLLCEGQQEVYLSVSDFKGGLQMLVLIGSSRRRSMMRSGEKTVLLCCYNFCQSRLDCVPEKGDAGFGCPRDTEAVEGLFGSMSMSVSGMTTSNKVACYECFDCRRWRRGQYRISWMTSCNFIMCFRTMFHE